MVFLYIFLCTFLVIAIFAIAAWLWVFVDIFEPIAALIRIRFEEQVAVWKIESIARVAKLEQQRLHDQYKP